MKSYLELKVPIRYVDSWFAELRELLDGVNVRWQRDYYHITMVFLDYAPDNVNLVPGLSERLEDALAPTITFDRLDAFATGGGHKQVIHLTTSHVPEDFLALVQDIRGHQPSGPARHHTRPVKRRVPRLQGQNPGAVEAGSITAQDHTKNMPQAP